jgi:hypothetical protein
MAFGAAGLDFFGRDPDPCLSLSPADQAHLAFGAAGLRPAQLPGLAGGRAGRGPGGSGSGSGSGLTEL